MIGAPCKPTLSIMSLRKCFAHQVNLSLNHRSFLFICSKYANLNASHMHPSRLLSMFSDSAKYGLSRNIRRPNFTSFLAGNFNFTNSWKKLHIRTLYLSSSNVSKQYKDSSSDHEMGKMLNNRYDECTNLDSEERKINSIRGLLNQLTVDQRREILLDLQLEEAAQRRKEAEEKLASWHWRSKFGRPTSIHPSKVDPSGTYCEIPQDWLLKKVAESNKILPPSFSDLRKIAVFNALPFVGFGFLDNLIMIVAGDYIDITIGTYLGISTMAAAALGNTVSDLAGIGSAWYVEFLSAKIGVRPPDLSQEQQDMASSRWSANIGRGVGVCVGCILGMFPLLLLSKHSPNKRKKAEGGAVTTTASPSEGQQPTTKTE